MIRLKRVVKRYKVGAGQVEALAGIDLEVGFGAAVVFVGPSGSGKSTLLHVIGGMDRVDQGEVYVGKEILHRLSPAALTRFRRHNVGFVFQTFNLLPNLTALENVALPAEFAGKSTREAAARAAELLRHVGLGERMRHRPNQLSGGEQQRVAVARALVNRPSLILADEPTGNLDSKNGAAIIDLLASFAGEHTVIVATHDERLSRIASRVIHLRDGQIMEDRSPAHDTKILP